VQIEQIYLYPRTNILVPYIYVLIEQITYTLYVQIEQIYLYPICANRTNILVPYMCK